MPAARAAFIVMLCTSMQAPGLIGSERDGLPAVLCDVACAAADASFR